MLSKYFKLRVISDEFKSDVLQILEELQNKKVLIYGAGEGFLENNRVFGFTEKLNVVGISDKKFEKSSVTSYAGIKVIKPSEISNFEYDFVLVTNELATPIIVDLLEKYDVDKYKIKQLFQERFQDEVRNINCLFDFNFDKTFPKLVKKLKGKKVILYGAGAFLKAINKYFDISELDIIAISDKRFASNSKNKTFLNYPTCSPYDIDAYKPDYVIVTTKFYLSVIDDLYHNVLKGTKIKIQPIFNKGFWRLLSEVWK